MTSLTSLDLVQEVRRLEDAASRNEEELGNLAPAGLSSTENRGIRYIIKGGYKQMSSIMAIE